MPDQHTLNHDAHDHEHGRRRNDSHSTLSHEDRRQTEPAAEAPGLAVASAMLGNRSVSHRANSASRAAAMHRMNSTYGNRALQRFVNTGASARGLAEGEDQDLAERIDAASGMGKLIDAGIRARLEAALGADFSAVRVHTGVEADHLAQSVHAVAFTRGQDIFFRTGEYDPQSADGFRLLAHEATHTVQQAAGPVAGTASAGGVSLSDPSDSFEQAAEEAADNALDFASRAADGPAPHQAKAAGSSPQASTVGSTSAGTSGAAPVQRMMSRVGATGMRRGAGVIRRPMPSVPMEEIVRRPPPIGPITAPGGGPPGPPRGPISVPRIPDLPSWLPRELMTGSRGGGGGDAPYDGPTSVPYEPSFPMAYVNPHREEEEEKPEEEHEEQGRGTGFASMLSTLNDVATAAGPFLGPKMSKAATGVSVANAGADPSLANGLDAAISLGSRFLGPVGTAHTALSAASTAANFGVRGMNKWQGLEGEDAYKEFRSPTQFMLDELPKAGRMIGGGMQRMDELGMSPFDL